jgi:hypothetical protein
MNCPQCSYPNPQGVTYCQMCYEVFNRSAADRYMQMQKRARARSGDEHASTPTEPEVTDPNATRVLSETSVIDWRYLFSKAVDFFTTIRVRTYKKEISLALAVIVLGVWAATSLSTENRLRFFGYRLHYDFAVPSTMSYLVLLHTDLHSWSERDGRLDTPMENTKRDELGRVSLRTYAERKTRRLVVEPQEWVINQTGRVSQSVPLNHPSMEVIQATINRGSLDKRITKPFLRTGRAALFTVPLWPKNKVRPGEQWTEPVSWVETIGEWKILWKGQLHWEMVGQALQDQAQCIRLRYTAEVVPSLWETPVWAQNAVDTLRFVGENHGELFFDTRLERVSSNELWQDGVIKIAIKDIYRIPLELRVGRLPRGRHGQGPIAQPGTLLLQFKNHYSIRKS